MEQQKQQNMELNLEVVSKMLGDKDIAILSLQSMVQRLMEELRILKEKPVEIVKE